MPPARYDDPKRFTLTQDHVKLLRASYVRWDDCEFGAAAIDSKRPYGNSDVLTDIAEALGISADGQPNYEADEDWRDEQWRGLGERLTALHKETETALQVVLAAGSFEPGEYESTWPSFVDWKRVG
jgi:hypothetical protein